MSYLNGPFLVRFIQVGTVEHIYADTEAEAARWFAGAMSHPQVRAAELWQRQGEEPRKVRRVRLAYYNQDGNTHFLPIPFEAVPVY